MAGLAKRLDEEQRSNKRLRKMLREERAMHLEAEKEKDDEILELRIQIAKLEDRLKSALARKDGWSGGPSGRQKKVARLRKVTDGTD